MTNQYFFSDQVSPKMWDLLDYIDRQARPDKPLFVVYCKFLSKLSDAAPLEIFHFVSGHGAVFSDKLDLKMVSRLLQKSAEMYAVRQNAANQNRPIKVEVDILVSMLMVIEAVSKPDFIGQIVDNDLGAETMFKVTLKISRSEYVNTCGEFLLEHLTDSSISARSDGPECVIGSNKNSL